MWGARAAGLSDADDEGGAIAAIGVSGRGQCSVTASTILRGIKVLGIDMPSTLPPARRELWEEVIGEGTPPDLVDAIASGTT